MVRDLTSQLQEVFQQRFGISPELVVRAPGRVNLIGEHTDYNGGFVLPCAIGLETQIASRRRADGQVRIVALDIGGEMDEFSVLDSGPIAHSDKPWANYLRGVFNVLQDSGVKLSGVDLAVNGSIPQGAGLSSSASLAVACALTLRELLGLTDIDTTGIAQIAQRAESDFVGCQCGIMDQLISTRGQADHAVLIDCRDLTSRQIALPDDLAVMIVHSGISRGLVDGQYNERRAQCEQAAVELGVSQLRDADISHLISQKSNMDDVIYRRARHVISENARTLAATELLEASNLEGLGVLMAESHQSMRNDFEISVDGIDRLVEILQNAIGKKGGARMTGGGFGGAVVALMRTEEAEQVARIVDARYQTPAGDPPVVMLERASACASIVNRVGP